MYTRHIYISVHRSIDLWIEHRFITPGSLSPCHFFQNCIQCPPRRFVARLYTQWARGQIYTYEYIYSLTHTHIYTHKYTHTHIYLSIYLSIYITWPASPRRMTRSLSHSLVGSHTHTHTHTHIYLSIYCYIYLYLYLYLYMHTQTHTYRVRRVNPMESRFTSLPARLPVRRTGGLTPNPLGY